MAKLTAKKDVNLLIFLSVAVYFFSYLTRINYAAIIVELVSEQLVTKSEAAVVTTVAFITYGAGQLVSGYIGDRFSPRYLIFYGYIATVTMNFLMPIFSFSFGAMAIIWGINGVAQAFMWPPLVKIMTAALSAEDYSKAVPLIGLGSGSATIIVYLTAPLIIKYLDWRFIFYIFGALALAASFSWIIVTGKLLKNVEIKLGTKKKTQKKEITVHTRETRTADVLLKLLPVIMLSIAIQGVLRDGITTWMPTFMSETFDMASTTSILTAVGLPIFHVLTNLVTGKVVKLMKYDIFKTIIAYFVIAAVIFLVMLLFGMSSMWVALLLISVGMGLVTGVNLLQTGYIPKYFISTGAVSTVSGVLNFSTYIGSAVSTYLFAVISEKFGWNFTVLSWVIFGAVGGLITLSVKAVVSRTEKKNEG